MGAEAGDGGGVHVAADAGLLLRPPARHRLPIRGGKEGQGIQHRPGALIGAGQRLVGVGAPDSVRVFAGFKGIDRPGQQGCRLWTGADAPAFQDEQINARKAPPVLGRQAIIGQFVENRQGHWLAGADAGQHMQQQRQIVRARHAAGGKQRMDAGGQGLAPGFGQIEIIKRGGHGHSGTKSVCRVTNAGDLATATSKLATKRAILPVI